MAEDYPKVRSQRYRDVLDYEVGARVVVEFSTRGREVIDYAVVLTVDDEDGEAVTVRVYDGSHGVNEMHRHDRAGEKAPAESFHAGTLGEGMRAAIVAVRVGFKEMIDGWRAT
jgi:ferredoxin-NADP reductase